MHVFVLVTYILAALAFGIEAVALRSLIALGLLFWVLVYLMPMLVK
jgi:hypothetical protein